MNRFLLIFILFGILASCSKDQRQQFEYAGGKVTIALDNEPSTLIPNKVLDYYSATVLNQVTEGLVGIDSKSMKIIPKLATKWTKSDDGKTYTFTIRDNVYFHPHDVFKNDEERLLTTADVVRSFEYACQPDDKGMASATYSMVLKSVVKGADEYYKGASKNISGIKVNGNEVQFELVHSDHNFLYKLAHTSSAILSHKIIDAHKETDVIGTGPFIWKRYSSNDLPYLLLLKNPDYYLNDDQGNALPYLDSLEFVFQSRKMEQLELFENEDIQMILSLPTSKITQMLEGKIEDFNSKPPKLILANNPLLEVDFYFFDMTDERFKDARVRKAFNYALDKKVIGRDILRNQYYDLGYYGIIPPISKSLKGYDFASIKDVGFDYNPELARKLLAEAGYPNGEGFGSVQLRYNIDETHSSVADEFAKQISKVLNINVNIDGSHFNQLVIDGETGNGDIFRLGWSADYPSPESFLVNFYGKNVPDNIDEPSRINKSRYVNPAFDEFYERATGTQKLTDQMKYFNKAEIALMEDPPLIPLWYTGDIALVYSYVRNFHFNPLNYMDFTQVYLKEWTEDEYQQLLNETN